MSQEQSQPQDPFIKLPSVDLEKRFAEFADIDESVEETEAKDLEERLKEVEEENEPTKPKGKSKAKKEEAKQEKEGEQPSDDEEEEADDDAEDDSKEATKEKPSDLSNAIETAKIIAEEYLSSFNIDLETIENSKTKEEIDLAIANSLNNTAYTLAEQIAKQRGWTDDTLDLANKIKSGISPERLTERSYIESMVFNKLKPESFDDYDDGYSLKYENAVKERAEVVFYRDNKFSQRVTKEQRKKQFEVHWADLTENKDIEGIDKENDKYWKEELQILKQKEDDDLEANNRKVREENERWHKGVMDAIDKNVNGRKLKKAEAEAIMSALTSRSIVVEGTGERRTLAQDIAVRIYSDPALLIEILDARINKPTQKQLDEAREKGAGKTLSGIDKLMSRDAPLTTKIKGGVKNELIQIGSQKGLG